MEQQLILVLNCGSSSIKFSIVNPVQEITIINGMVETLKDITSIVIQDLIKKKKIIKQFNKIDTYKKIIELIYDILLDRYTIYLTNILGIGHRVVHGGPNIKQSMIINQSILSDIKKSSIFAPLHNPYHVSAIQVSWKKISRLKNCNVAVFDTSFHQTMPKESFLYAIPYHFYSHYDIRRYGAHGINHLYVTKKCSVILKKSINQLNIISCHLGSGSSITAILNGKSVDTSMGLTPLEGLVMGTRCGDLDPYIIFHMVLELKIPIEEVKKILIERSGVLGISSLTSDFKKLEKIYYINQKAKLSVKMFCRRVSKYIGGYSTLMSTRIDAIVFTGGIGENSSLIRQKIVDKLFLLGFKIDLKKNSIINKKNRFINSKNSIPILVIPADENQMIAQETYHLLKQRLYI